MHYRKKKIARLDDLFVHAFTAKKKNLRDLTIFLYTTYHNFFSNFTENKKCMHVATGPTCGPILILGRPSLEAHDNQIWSVPTPTEAGRVTRGLGVVGGGGVVCAPSPHGRSPRVQPSGVPLRPVSESLGCHSCRSRQTRRTPGTRLDSIVFVLRFSQVLKPLVTHEMLRTICSHQDIDDEMLYRLDEARLLAWLRLKAKKLFALQTLQQRYGSLRTNARAVAACACRVCCGVP